MATTKISDWSAHPPFATLDLCITHVREAHSQRLVKAPAKEIESGEMIEATMPSYLYRGEVGWIDECLSRAERIRRGHFVGVTTQELDPIGQDLDGELQARLGIGPMLSAGLMQHYGYPTELMDATVSLDTAAFFSQTGCRRDEHWGGSRVRYAVSDSKRYRYRPDVTSVGCAPSTAERIRRV